MKKVTHLEKVLWELYNEYNQIPEEIYLVSHHVDREYIRDRNGQCLPNRYGSIIKRYSRKYCRRSKEQWNFINKKYHQITIIDPIYGGSIEDFINYLEYNVDSWSCSSKRRSPYEQKESWSSNKWGRRWRRWGLRQKYAKHETCTKYQKKPEHQKKYISEETQQKNDWREKKGFARDYRRMSRNHSSSHRQFKKACTSRVWRRITKQRLGQERWENAPSMRSRRQSWKVRRRWK